MVTLQLDLHGESLGSEMLGKSHDNVFLLSFYNFIKISTLPQTS